MPEVEVQLQARPAARAAGLALLSPRRWLDALGRALSGQEPYATRAALLGFALLALYYFWNLDANLINDDEGSYLYAAWRISLGELPYRDFLTPQLPAFLMPGGWLMRLVGPEVWPLRAASALFSLGAGLFTWRTAKRLFGGGVGLVAGLGFALHPLVFYYGRLYRAEPSMLFFAAAGMYAFARAAFPGEIEPDPDPDAQAKLPGILAEPEALAMDRRWLVAAGAGFGLAVLSKLFGALPMAGCGLWLLVDGLRRRRIGPMLVDGIVLTLSAALVAGLPLLWFRSISDQIEKAVLEHHLMQGADMSLGQEIAKTLEFYFQFIDIDQGGLLIFAGLAVAIVAWRRSDRRVLLFGCQLFSLLGFFLLTRELFIRHLMYLLPSLSTLVGLALVPLITRSRQLPSDAADPDVVLPRPSALESTRQAGALAVALLASLVLPWLHSNTVLGLETETATRRLADFISLTTQPDDLVFGDFSELNFYALRPTSYEGASMSAGAAASGQLAWSVVGPRFSERRPALLVNLSAARHDVGHLPYMPDYADYLDWIDQHYVKLGSFERDWQSFQLFEPKEAPLPRLARFADGPRLLAARPAVDEAQAGDIVEVETAWQNGPPEEAGTEYVATLRLVDQTGIQWAQWDSSLFAYPERKSPKWAADELASQRLPVTIPADAPPGNYRLEVGMYRRNGADVPQLDAAGGEVWGRALAGTIRVTAGRLKDIPEGAEVAERYDLPMADGALTLLGRGPLPEEPVEAGGTIPVELWWRVEVGGSPSALPAYVWTGLAHEWDGTLGGGDTPSGGYDNSPPTGQPAGGLRRPLGLLPAESPQRPYVFRQRVYLALPLGVQGPGSRSILALLDAEGRTLGNGTLRLGGVQAFGNGAVEPPEDSSAGLDAVAGDLAALEWARPAGSAIATTTSDPAAAEQETDPQPNGPLALARPGGTLALELGWRSLRQDESLWSVSLQLLDAEGQPLAQVDGPAGGWDHPSNQWRAGERFEQALALELPTNLPAADYRLVLAVYHPQTGYRLPMAGAQADGDLAQLGTVRILSAEDSE
jgi:4-amino-4-deoxy-L-arabinose transferase-like glycosyltransferase